MTAICFSLFLAAVITAVVLDLSLLYPIGFGTLLFALTGCRRGYRVRTMWKAAWSLGRKMCRVLIIYALIGCITGLWRSSGTIAWCICFGTRLITPHLFILVTFVLTCALSYAIGTSFGVVGTAGMILMALARTGGVDLSVTAGAIIAGAYFGDRCSPASSSASLVAVSTETALPDNLKAMRRSGWLPLLLSVGVYTLLSFRHPIQTVDRSLLDAMEQAFTLRWWTMLPAAAIVALPLCRVPVRLSMAASVLLAFAASVGGQGVSIAAALRTAVLGYQPESAVLSDILSGGGVISMVGCSLLAMAASMYAGLLGGIGALDEIRSVVSRIAARAGLFSATTLSYLLLSLVFCNQSTGAIFTPQLLGDTYRLRGASKSEMALDMENSGIVLSALIPWNISVSVPLVMLDADARAIPYAVLLYLIPLCYALTKKFFYPRKEERAL